jgi:uncharacterized phage protein gp47/JayE
MSFQRPTLAQIVDRVQADFVSRLDLASAVLRRSVVYVLTRVIAGAAHMLHGHLEFLARQLFPDLSEDAFLLRQAALFVGGPNPPGFATGTIACTGVDGSPIGLDELLVSSGGLEYKTTTAAVVAGGTASVDVIALLAGPDSTLSVGVALSFESPIVGVSSTATVTASLEDGTAAETIDELRVRLLERMAEPAHGGSSPDYVAWAKEVPGVTRVWVTPLGLGPGTVVVRFVRDDDVSPIPDAGEVTAVQTKLDTEKPAHATVTAIAPIDAPIAMTIHIVPDSTDLRNAVKAELADTLRRTQSPGSTTLLSSLLTAIGNTAGITDFTLTVPAANVPHTTGQLASVGTVTWT